MKNFVSEWFSYILIFLGCDDTCDDSVSAIKGAIAGASAAEVEAAVGVAIGYLGLDDVTFEQGLDWADNFDWCAYEDKVNMCLAHFV